MPFRLEISHLFERDAGRLDNATKKRLVKIIAKILADPLRFKPLRHFGQNVFRARFEQCRLVFSADTATQTVILLFIGKRDDVYKKFSETQ